MRGTNLITRFVVLSKFSFRIVFSGSGSVNLTVIARARDLFEIASLGLDPRRGGGNRETTRCRWKLVGSDDAVSLSFRMNFPRYFKDDRLRLRNYFKDFVGVAKATTFEFRFCTTKN